LTGQNAKTACTKIAPTAGTTAHTTYGKYNEIIVCWTFIRKAETEKLF
jgi:hypothetical protein